MDLCNRNDIQALLLRHGFRFSKSMGQNFLIADWVPRNTAEASGADKNSGVLEVGPGIGPLTRELCQRAGKVVSVEVEVRLRQLVVAEHFAGLRPILCANLPYNITTPLLTACVKAKCFTSITVLIQKEVAQRICAQPGTADYGAFTLLMQYYTEPELLFTVPNTCFLPMPKVTSAVIRCITREKPPVAVQSEAMLWRTVKAGFALRRKTLANSLQTGFPLSKQELTQMFSGLRQTGRCAVCRHR